MEMFDSKEDIEHVSKSIDNNKIAENDYNLSVSSYVEPKDTQKKIIIVELNNEVSKTVSSIDSLRAEIDKIINEIDA